MTEFLLRRFAASGDAQAQRAAAGRLAGWTGIVCNLLLFCAKLAAGLLSGAVSVVADAVNNLTDASSSVITLLGFRLAQRPADKEHPYGHARYEYIAGLVIAALILLLGVELAKGSLAKIFRPAPVELSALTFAVLGISVLVKLWMGAFYRKLAARMQAAALHAAAVDSRNDAISTLAVLVGCLIAFFFHSNVDGWLGLAVAGFILYSGVGVARDTISPLLGERADPDLRARIGALLGENGKVLGYHDLLIHDYGPGRCFASLHAELSDREDPQACHAIIDGIEEAALSRLGVHLVIHWDPVAEDDGERETMRRMVEEITHGLHPDISVHDFRLVREEDGVRLAFGLVIPYTLMAHRDTLREALDAALLMRGKDYRTSIHFDGEG